MAAEDFYFLQHLARTGGVGQVKETVVYPSARPSHRVPFGTGRIIGKLLAGEEEAVLFHRKESFQILKDWLNLVSSNPAAQGEDLRDRAERISPHLAVFLDKNQFTATWLKLKKNFRDPAKLLSAFHGWFDGLKTMKLIHHLAAGPLPNGKPEEIMPGLLEWSGLPPMTGVKEQLSLLRQTQMAIEY
ncbi:MAG: hypothetical protein NTY64_13350 [Deltaproteobacteria bacterium]|nr:hypothetical protein [Deltaproteobacteria bacterium]